ncbi:MAG: hypothetical protein V4805_17655 [Pseudomonadota bacterium]
MAIGTNFDDFLKEKGIYETCTAAAKAKVLAWQIEGVNQPMDDEALRDWEDSRDMAAELEQSINEILTRQDEPVAAVRLPMPSSVDLTFPVSGILKDALCR